MLGHSVTTFMYHADATMPADTEQDKAPRQLTLRGTVTYAQETN